MPSQARNSYEQEEVEYNLVHYLWLDIDQGRIDQMMSLSIEYPWKQLD
jgi:hypothetical protein